jgi:hypothetical protein
MLLSKKAYGGVKELLHAFLTTAIGGSKLSASCPCLFTSIEKLPVSFM